MSYAMLRNRWDEARENAAAAAKKNGDTLLPIASGSFSSRIFGRKLPLKIEDLTTASKLLGHSKEDITKAVYRRVGEVVNPTK